MGKIEQINEMLLQSPKDSFLRHALALEKIKIGEKAEAQQIFEELLQDDPAYVGSYYHLGKLLQETGSPEAIAQCYEKGMEMALKANYRHAYNELRSAYEEYLY